MLFLSMSSLYPREKLDNYKRQMETVTALDHGYILLRGLLYFLHALDEFVFAFFHALNLFDQVEVLVGLLFDGDFQLGVHFVQEGPLLPELIDFFPLQLDFGLIFVEFNFQFLVLVLLKLNLLVQREMALPVELGHSVLMVSELLHPLLVHFLQVFLF